MRILATVLWGLALPAGSFASGPDDCWFDGEQAGRPVRLEHQVDGVYGSAEAFEYARCTLLIESGGERFLSCAKTPGGVEVARYQARSPIDVGRSPGSEPPNESYVCVSGCTSEVVKVFHSYCQAGC